MGSTDPDAGPYERPVHEVYVDAFRMMDAPVTNFEFASFVEATDYATTAEQMLDGMQRPSWREFASLERADHPVVCVSWVDAVAYSTWLTKHMGSQFRLPTEAEWEKAARGGLEQNLFPWGDDDATGRACWNRWNVLPNGTQSVRSFASNGYGLFDMAGNVWEWCHDYYYDDAYAQHVAAGVVHNPTGPSEGRLRVRRSAAWNIGEPFRMRCANRGAMIQTHSWPNMGIRLVTDV